MQKLVRSFLSMFVLNPLMLLFHIMNFLTGGRPLPPPKLRGGAWAQSPLSSPTLSMIKNEWDIDGLLFKN